MPELKRMSHGEKDTKIFSNENILFSNENIFKYCIIFI